MGRMIIIKKSFTNPKSIYAILLLSVFTFLFLGAEYLYVNMISLTAGEEKTVIAQNYALGISAVGFLLYPLFHRLLKRRVQIVGLFILALAASVCNFLVQKHVSYSSTLLSGMALFLFLGILGSAAHYLFFKLARDRTHLARMVGVSYALGIFLQFLNNNLVDLETAEALILSLFALVALALLLKAERLCRQENAEAEELQSPAIEDDGKGTRKKIAAGGLLALLVILMACIFSTLDNAVTMHHAAGTDIGQWPRLLLAVSGLSAGFLFDIRKRKFMAMMMYCVMLMSVICLVVLKLGGPFLIGLIVFYLSAGFFVVFFTTSFLDFARHMPTPALWAGMGRAMNNVSAALFTNGSVALLATGNSLAAIVIALVLFVAVSVAMAVYTARMNAVMEPKEPPASQKSDEERREAFIAKYGLTEREWDVFSQMISSDSSAQEIADCLFLSKRTVERHISALYEKTGAKSRITMYLLYRND